MKESYGEGPATYTGPTVEIASWHAPRSLLVQSGLLSSPLRPPIVHIVGVPCDPDACEPAFGGYASTA